MAPVLLFIGIGAFSSGCQPPAKEVVQTQTSTEQDTMQARPVVYQIFTRLFGNTNTSNIPWGTSEENGVGKFDDITPKALQEIKKLGITHVWYTGVIEHALLTDYTAFGIPLDDADVVKGRAGSPYAIKDYYDVNPDLALSVPDRLKEFDQLIARTHEAGMKVLIDFVPNHVARQYQSDVKPGHVEDFGEKDAKTTAFSPNNNFYYIPGEAFEVPEGYHSLGPHEFPTKDGRFTEEPAKATGNDVFRAKPSVHDWFETVKLNYGVNYLDDGKKYFEPIPDTWLKMKDILLYWAGKNVDGFRCDMAEMVPVEFWAWVTKEVKSEYPDIVFLAEIYNPGAYRDYLFTGGFDYLYDKVEMYDTLKHIIQKTASTDDITAIWQRQEGIAPYMLRFLENHDEQRIASPDFAGDMWKGVPMMAVSSFMHSGPVLLYFGQEVGEPGQGESGFSGDDGRTTIFDYWGVPEHVKWVNNGKYDGGKLSNEQKALRAAYAKILNACNENEALRAGNFFDLHYYNRTDAFTGYSDQVYAFLRYTDHQRLLVVTNFSEQQEAAHLKIPQSAWEAMKLSGESVLFTHPDNGHKIEINRQNAIEYPGDGLKLELEPLSYVILEVD